METKSANRRHSLKLLYKKLKKHFLQMHNHSKQAEHYTVDTTSRTQQHQHTEQERGLSTCSSRADMTDSCISIASRGRELNDSLSSTAGNTVDIPRHHDVATLLETHRSQCASESATCTYSLSTKQRAYTTSPTPVYHAQSADSGLYCDDDDEELEDGVFVDEGDDSYSLLDDDGWQIAAREVSLDKVIVSTDSETVYSGYWHGNVSVHARLSSDEESFQSVLSDVNTLSNIRHENIQLFLGVCHDLHDDCVSIVMDQMKGHSLHTLLHKQGHQFNFQAVNKIMTQIAQGMEYLHAKGIPHTLLASNSITVHYRVCISMLSPGQAKSGLVEPEGLTYLAPEVIRTVSKDSSNKWERSVRVDPVCMQTCEANVFSFGTLLYEMLTMNQPFPDVPNNLIIWAVGNNRTFPLHRITDSFRFKQIISDCWTTSPQARPTFKEVLSTLEHNLSRSPKTHRLTSKFSFSEPSQLPKLGL